MQKSLAGSRGAKAQEDSARAMGARSGEECSRAQQGVIMRGRI